MSEETGISFQTFLLNIGACPRARLWVGNKSMKQCWDAMSFVDWPAWLLERLWCEAFSCKHELFMPLRDSIGRIFSGIARGLAKEAYSVAEKPLPENFDSMTMTEIDIDLETFQHVAHRQVLAFHDALDYDLSGMLDVIFWDKIEECTNNKAVRALEIQAANFLRASVKFEDVEAAVTLLYKIKDMYNKVQALSEIENTTLGACDCFSCVRERMRFEVAETQSGAWLHHQGGRDPGDG